MRYFGQTKKVALPAVLAALSVLMIAGNVPAHAQGQSRTAFTVGGATAAAGTKSSGFIEVAAVAGKDEGARIPVTVIHGAKPGPVLGLVAGTHGYEYAPVVAMQKFPGMVNPTELSGTIVVVHVANVPSFFGRTIYYSPADGKNLNRVYPGKADGTLSERIAFAITKEVIDRSDYLVDLHCGDGNEDLRPYLYWMTSGTPEVAAKSKDMAQAFGLEYIVIDESRSNDPTQSVYTANTAITRGKPAITTETGGLGRVDDEGPGLAVDGVFNLLRYYKMLPGQPRRAARTTWIDKNEVLRSSVTGTFHAKVKSGQMVAQGAVLGVLTDLFGNILKEVKAPFAGVILYVVATPPVREGEPLGMVGHIQGK